MWLVAKVWQINNGRSPIRQALGRWLRIPGSLARLAPEYSDSFPVPILTAC